MNNKQDNEITENINDNLLNVGTSKGIKFRILDNVKDNQKNDEVNKNNEEEKNNEQNNDENNFNENNNINDNDDINGDEKKESQNKENCRYEEEEKQWTQEKKTVTCPNMKKIIYTNKNYTNIKPPISINMANKKKYINNNINNINNTNNTNNTNNINNEENKNNIKLEKNFPQKKKRESEETK